MNLHRMQSLKTTSPSMGILANIGRYIQQIWQLGLELLRGEKKELPRFANSVALILGRFASSGLGFLTWMIIARLYVPSEMGIASGLVSAMMLLVQLSMLGIGAAFIARLPHHPHRSARLLDTSLNIVSALALISAGGFILLSSWFFHELRIVADQPGYAFLFLGMVLFGTLYTLMDHFSIAIRRSDQVLSRNVLHGVVAILAAGAFPLLFQSSTSIFIIFSWTLAGLGSCALGLVQLWRSMSRYIFRLSIDRQMAKELVATGLPNYLLTMSERAPNWILPILVTEMLSPADNARWYTVWMMAWVVFQIPISIGQNLFADVARHPDKLKSSIRYSHRTSLILGSLAAVGVLIFAPLMLSLLGKEYAAIGTLPLRIISLAVYPVVFIQAYYAVCRGVSRLFEATMTGLISGIVGVAAAITMGMAYGLPGMAIAWLITQSMAGLWAMWRTRYLVRHSPASSPSSDEVSGDEVA